MTSVKDIFYKIAFVTLTSKAVYKKTVVNSIIQLAFITKMPPHHVLHRFFVNRCRYRDVESNFFSSESQLQSNSIQHKHLFFCSLNGSNHSLDPTMSGALQHLVSFFTLILTLAYLDNSIVSCISNVFGLLNKVRIDSWCYPNTL